MSMQAAGLGAFAGSFAGSLLMNLCGKTPSKETKALAKAVAKMDGTVGFDIVIVCTSNPSQEAYWQARLEYTRGQCAKADCTVLAVHEDWAGDGAGNGLGTLYAYQKAAAKAKEMGLDLDKQLASGASVGMYHTAGKGTRLAPLPGSENNNKPGVKLASLVSVGSKLEELTILEAVIRQTGVYGPLRRGRVSVFWGDQIFVPSAGFQPSGGYHADILSLQGPMPSEAEWKAKGLDKYGLICARGDGEATQVEKVDYATATGLLKDFGKVKSVGPSLGSFSISKELLAELLKEFAAELEGKSAKMDSDPHFWMPLTLKKEPYVGVMVKKKEMSAEDAGKHWDRMQALAGRVLGTKKAGLFGCVDVGDKGYWWDYGMLRLYIKNNKLALENSPEAAALRWFLRIPDSLTDQSNTDGYSRNKSVVLNSQIRSGKISNSVCTTVTCAEANVQDCILVNVTATKINAKGCVLYNVVCDDPEGLNLKEGEVMTNVFMPDAAHIVQKSTVTTDGGQVFKKVVPPNKFSFQDVYDMNKTSDVAACYSLRKQRGDDVARRLMKIVRQ